MSKHPQQAQSLLLKRGGIKANTCCHALLTILGRDTALVCLEYLLEDVGSIGKCLGKCLDVDGDDILLKDVVGPCQGVTDEVIVMQGTMLIVPNQPLGPQDGQVMRYV